MKKKSREFTNEAKSNAAKLILFSTKYRSSQLQMFFEVSVLKYFAKILQICRKTPVLESFFL